ncbi:MAG: phage protein Gp27 family protein [Candidatus Binataceae bacterium]
MSARAPLPPAAAGKAPGRPPLKGKLKQLPAAVREELDHRLVEGGFRDYRGLAKWLGENGCQITPSSVWNYGSKLEKRLNTIRLATAEARAVVAASPENEDRMSEALLRLIQQHLFEVLVDLKAGDLTQVNLGALARTVAHMARASIMQKKWAEEMRANFAQKVDTAERKVVLAARAAANSNGGGLTPEAEAGIRKALLEITE